MDEIQPIRVLTQDLVLVDWGPMTMTVSVWDDGIPRPVIAAKAAVTALESLTIMADFQGFLRLKVPQAATGRPLPGVVKRALKAAGSVSSRLSSLAAVAGATADETADAAAQMGGTRIIVNNGGDVALLSEPGSTITVGVKAPGMNQLLGKLAVRGDLGIRGVATSGWRGRSWSPGVADLVSVWATDAATADAAATFIAGRAVAAGPGVERRPAVELDPMSDLGKSLVTTTVRDLDPRQRRTALEGCAAAVEELHDRGVIRGCYVNIQGDSFLMDPEGIMSPK